MSARRESFSGGLLLVIFGLIFCICFFAVFPAKGRLERENARLHSWVEYQRRENNRLQQKEIDLQYLLEDYEGETAADGLWEAFDLVRKLWDREKDRLDRHTIDLVVKEIMTEFSRRERGRGR